MRFGTCLIALTLVACGTVDPTDTTDDTDTNSTTETEENTIDLTIPAKGTFSSDAFTPADDYASATFISQTVDSDKVATVSIAGKVSDFQTDDPRGSTKVSLWYDDLASGTADATADTTNEQGDVSISAPSCQSMTYLALRDPGINDAKATYKAHQIYAPSEGGAIDAEFLTVSTDTYLLIPSILGISPDTTKSIIAGTAYDITRAPELSSDDNSGKVEGVQVVVRGLDGSIPEGVFVRYYVEEFPSRDQKHTSADGLWTAIDVPPGDWRVEMWGQVNGEDKLLGTTELKAYADSINIANIFAGYEGVKYPEACLEAAGGDTDDTDDTDLGL